MDIDRNELAFLLQMASDPFGKHCTASAPFEQIKIPRLLSIAKLNGMEYWTADTIAKKHAKLDPADSLSLQNVFRANYDKFKQMQSTLLMADACLDDYRLIKTYRTLTRIPHDLDILVRDLTKAINALSSVGIDSVKCMDGAHKAILLKGEIKIHLHESISWCEEGSVFFDNELLWDKPRTVTWGQTRTKIPNVNADFLMHLAHINFECLHITLSDLLYLYEIANEVDCDFILEQAREYKWNSTLIRSIKLLDKIHHTIYFDNCPFKKWVFEHRRSDNLTSVLFPVSLPRAHIVQAFLEKQMLLWVMQKKILKSVYILMSGDAYTPLYKTKNFKHEGNKL